ncbi:hypothetical protein [Niallia sp. RD1]|uniref:hypothetical protein n=1 Tax=Niallia sp. RD1 TaxID=2962858 RepID=UPI0020C19FAA|nr:hypothetical protein [Niallia sp. RD1]UTI43181.1 hypothetical protein NKG37_05500 [Niallia sp. RD1]
MKTKKAEARGKRGVHQANKSQKCNAQAKKRSPSTANTKPETTPTSKTKKLPN